MAQKLGYFEEAGLDVSIDTPVGPVGADQAGRRRPHRPGDLLRARGVLAREQGLDVVAVGALVNRPLTSMIWLKKSGIKGVADLRGKTIATAGIPYQDAYLKTILARANLSPDDVKAVNVGFGLLPAIIGGRAEAMLGGFSNVEGVDLRDARQRPGRHPGRQARGADLRRARPGRQREQLEEDPEPIRLFLAALARGTAAAVEEPGGGRPKRLLEANPDLEPKLTRAEVDGDAAAAQPRRRAAYGYMDTGRVARLHRLDARKRTDRLAAGAAEVLSDDYLPGEIPE